MLGFMKDFGLYPEVGRSCWRNFSSRMTCLDFHTRNRTLAAGWRINKSEKGTGDSGFGGQLKAGRNFSN